MDKDYKIIFVEDNLIGKVIEDIVITSLPDLDDRPEITFICFTDGTCIIQDFYYDCGCTSFLSLGYDITSLQQFKDKYKNELKIS